MSKRLTSGLAAIQAADRCSDQVQARREAPAPACDAAVSKGGRRRAANVTRGVAFAADRERLDGAGLVTAPMAVNSHPA